MLTSVKKQMSPLILIAVIGVAFAGVATAQVSYHLVRFSDIRYAIDVTESGVILAAGDIEGDMLVLPARDIAGNPVWDSDGDGIADGYTTISLNSGIYDGTSVSSVNESLDVVGNGYDPNGNQAALLWLNAPEGNPPIDLGQTFDLRDISASSINDLKQIVVLQFDGYFSGDPSTSWTIRAMSLVNPEDTDGDGVPDQWFKDDNGDGFNDLMINVAVKGPEFLNGGSGAGMGSINNFGEIAGRLSISGSRGFVIVPQDIDSDGQLEWFKDDDADGWNDLAQDLAPNMRTWDISDSGTVVGTIAKPGTDSYYYRWQIDSSGTVNLVAEEPGEYFMTGVNDMGQAVGYTEKRFAQNRLIYTTYLWEPDLTMTNLFDLLDNPNRKEGLRCQAINNAGVILVGVSENFLQGADIGVAVPSQDNASPEVSISSPADTTVVDSGVAVNFSGTASDAEDGDLSANLQWTSSIDGQIGIGSSFSAILSDGVHTITASATDSAGQVGSDSVSITVGTPATGVTIDGVMPDTVQIGTATEVVITGSGFMNGAQVTFENGSGPAPIADVTSVNDTTIQTMVSVRKKAKSMVWDVRVTNPDGSSDVLVGGISVTQ